jgi:hypothetical protein
LKSFMILSLHCNPVNWLDSTINIVMYIPEKQPNIIMKRS